MVVYYHEAMCHAEIFFHFLQGQGHIEGLYNQYMTIFTISSKLLVRLQSNLVSYYSIISHSVLWKCELITVVKVKVTAKVQNVWECLCGWIFFSMRPIMSTQYLLNRSDLLFFLFFSFNKLGMVVCYHEAECHAEKLVHHLQCQGHSEGLHN